MVTGAMIALVAQILIVVGTAASFVLSVETAFNSPMAIVNELREVSFGEAMVARTVGVVINSAIGAVAGLIGSALGGLVPGRAGAGS